MYEPGETRNAGSFFLARFPTLWLIFLMGKVDKVLLSGELRGRFRKRDNLHMVPYILWL